MTHFNIQNEMTRLGKYNDKKGKEERDEQMKDNPYPYVVDSLLLITKVIENHTEQLAKNEKQLVKIEERLASIEKHLRRSSLK